ncbi:tetratricopeptide repeat protein [Brucella gallinifaecis]|uniref:Tetratricopeptide repeat protein n=2 Tax=Brucella gallinifaecis TaxID=215590 RepID=A0A502BTL2_9HYPH|nr:tetratricopeptide repeat protein [Brucella gallinifaecis]TPF77197.1 tetratricopeptide repeat protein [Brucella gallinifaecis]
MRLFPTIAMALFLATGLSAPAQAIDTPPSTDLPDLSQIRAQIYSGDYKPAIAALLDLSKSVKHADLYNLLGFSLRNIGRYDEAGRWYKEALYYDPTHRAAIEYQGELYIKTGDLEAAQANVQLLKLLCPKGCKELDILSAALDKNDASSDSSKPGREHP